MIHRRDERQRAGHYPQRLTSPGVWIVLSILLFCVWVVSCSLPNPFPSPSATPQPLQPSPTASATFSIAPSPFEPTQTNEATFAGPSLPVSTAIPPPLDGIIVPDEVKSGVLLGLDSPNGRNGRSNAMVVFFINPRTSRASLITVPPDLFVYIPGITMQRINTAYPIGGIDLVLSTLKYNLGVRPDLWAVVHPDDFVNLVNDLGGIDVNVIDPIQNICDGFPVGDVYMDGQHALCYVTLLKPQENDPFQRSIRQEEILRALLLRMVNGGNLARLPDLYARYQTTIRTNVGLNDLEDNVPLLLNLGDAGRIGYFQVNKDLVTSWVLPPTNVNVYLPRREALQSIMQQVIDYVSEPQPLTERISTLVYELTISPTPSETPTITLTPTVTPTQTNTLTLVPSITRTPTITPTRTKTTTSRPTFTRTAIPSSTITLTPVGFRTATSTSTFTLTPSPSPSVTMTPTNTDTSTVTVNETVATP